MLTLIIKTTNIEQFAPISKGSYFNYLKLLRESKVVETLNERLLPAIGYDLTETLMCDTFTVKSYDGSEGVGRNPTTRRQRSSKVEKVLRFR
jgi:hypothetical protein